MPTVGNRMLNCMPSRPQAGGDSGLLLAYRILEGLCIMCWSSHVTHPQVWENIQQYGSIIKLFRISRRSFPDLHRRTVAKVLLYGAAVEFRLGLSVRLAVSINLHCIVLLSELSNINLEEQNNFLFTHRLKYISFFIGKWCGNLIGGNKPYCITSNNLA